MEENKKNCKKFCRIELLATFFYSGKISKFPGTIGTLASVPLAVGIAYLGLGTHMVFTLLLIIFSFFIVKIYEKQRGTHDSAQIVIDEVVGYLVATVALPFTFISFVGAFVLFRFFDILKPPPINWVDKKKDAWSVIADDILAGVFANVILQILFYNKVLNVAFFKFNFY